MISAAGKKLMPAIVLLIILICCSAASANEDVGMEIVADSEVRSVIVIAADAPEAVHFAAEELNHHIEKASGTKLRIIKEEKVTQALGGRIYIGNCKRTAAAGIACEKLPANGFVIKSVGNELFLAGNDSDGQVLGMLHVNRTKVGSLFAVYEFLEKQLQVKWLWPGELGEIVPKRTTIRTGNWDYVWQPQLVHTRLRDYSAWGDEKGWSSRETSKKYFRDQSIWMRRHRFAKAISMDYPHGFTDYWDRFGVSNPEFFALRPNGKRAPTGPARLVQMCVSEPKLATQAIEDWEKDRTAEEPWINGSENDRRSVDPPCNCVGCQRWDVPTEQKSLSDRYAKFWLRLQKLGEQTDPNATVIGYAYDIYNRAPVRAKLNDRIVVGIVPGFYFPWTTEKRRAFREQWSGWAKAGAQLYLRPNYFHDGHNMPMFFARAFAEDFRYASERGLLATDFDSLTGQWATQGPNLYALGRVHSRTDLSPEKILDEYYSAFGPAENQIRQYFSHWEAVSNAVTDESYDKAWKKKGIPDNPEHRLYRWAEQIFTPEVMRTGRELLDKAKIAAAKDELAARRVDFLDKGLRNAELTLAAQAAYERSKNSGDKIIFETALAKLVSFRRSVDALGIANMGYLMRKESATWDYSSHWP
jgi:hypothetical protein